MTADRMVPTRRLGKSVARAGYEFVVLPCGGGVGPDTENHDFLDFRAAPAFKRSFLTEKRRRETPCFV